MPRFPEYSRGRFFPTGSPLIHITRLSLSGFRNHLETNLELGPGLTVFVGQNGQGKSNLLEAVYMLAIAKSPRTSSDRELINWRIVEAGGHVQVLGVGREDDHTVQAQIDFDVSTPESAGRAPLMRKSLRVNGIVRSAADFVGNLNVVFFEADDLEIVTGPPSVRRRYLDILIAQARASYLKALQRYQKVVSQRNHLLRRVRDGAAAMEELAFWDERLAYEGAEIIQQRRDAVFKLTDEAVPAHHRLTGGHSLTLVYKPQLSGDGAGEAGVDDLNHAAIQERLSDGLRRARSREVGQGVSVVGPHRDDLVLLIDGKPAAAFASRGQARVIALSLKIAEAAFVRDATGRTPVLALDDILSELDPVRRELAMQSVTAYDQVLLTSTETGAVAPEFLDQATCYDVRDGAVYRDA